ALDMARSMPEHLAEQTSVRARSDPPLSAAKKRASARAGVPTRSSEAPGRGIPGPPGSSRIAVDRVAGEGGGEAERAEGGIGLGEADHGQGASVVLAVERREAGEPAVPRILGAVEPEAHVECVGRTELDHRIEAEDLIDEDGLDGGHVAVVVLHLEV